MCLGPAAAAYGIPCHAVPSQLQHIDFWFFRCLLFFFQSELPSDPRIPGVWVGGCLGTCHQCHQCHQAEDWPPDPSVSAGDGAVSWG